MKLEARQRVGGFGYDILRDGRPLGLALLYSRSKRAPNLTYYSVYKVDFRGRQYKLFAFTGGGLDIDSATKHISTVYGTLRDVLGA